jgi:poly-beta-1,6-N-acetyl-D-glucosamine synthase
MLSINAEDMSKRFLSTIIYIGLYIITAGVLYFSISLSYQPHGAYLLQNIIVFLSFFFLIKYFIYMTLSPWYDTALAIRKIKYRDIIARYQPKVSVLIPAWNEEVGLLPTVQSVLKSTYDNIEIVIINDGSTDTSDALMHTFLAGEGKKDAGKIIYHYQENAGKGHALNTGIRLSTGQLIMTIDADCVIQPDAIKHLVAHFSDPKVMAAVGNVKIGRVDSFVAMAQYLEFLFSFYFKKADSILGSIYIIGGAAGAFRREVFEELGGYSSENITEDIELTVRIQSAGMKIVYAADAIVYTEGASDLSGLRKQRLRWKRGRIDTFVKYRKLFFSVKKKHNTFLAWFSLPFAVFGDIELLFEIPFISFITILAILTHDFTPFIGTMSVAAFVFFIQTFSPDGKYTRKITYLLAPIGWLIFMVVTFVELSALMLSLKAMYSGEKTVWQRWQRKGL